MGLNAYLSSLGIDLTDAAQPAIARLVLAGELVLGGEHGVVLRPMRGDVSDRYLELLAGDGRAFVIVDRGSYPSFYARELGGSSLGGPYPSPTATAAGWGGSSAPGGG